MCGTAAVVGAISNKRARTSGFPDIYINEKLIYIIVIYNRAEFPIKFYPIYTLELPCNENEIVYEFYLKFCGHASSYPCPINNRLFHIC